MTEAKQNFEAWYVNEHCKDLSAISIPEIMNKNLLGEYSSFHVNGAYSAWQHQQQRIDELERERIEADKRATKYAFQNDVMALRLGENESKLKIAVDALNVYAKSSQSVPSLAIEALKQIEATS